MRASNSRAVRFHSSAGGEGKDDAPVALGGGAATVAGVETPEGLLTPTTLPERDGGFAPAVAVAVAVVAAAAEGCPGGNGGADNLRAGTHAGPADAEEGGSPGAPVGTSGGHHTDVTSCTTSAWCAVENTRPR